MNQAKNTHAGKVPKVHMQTSHQNQKKHGAGWKV